MKVNLETNWICAQLGAREHYAIPRALHNLGRLRELHSDFWAGPFIRALGPVSGSTSLRSLSSRFHPDLGSTPTVVHSRNWRTVGWHLRTRGAAAESRYLGYIAAGQRFACTVRDTVKKHPDLGTNTIFFSYD